MIPVGDVVVLEGENVLFEHLNDIVAQSHKNNLGRSSTLGQLFLMTPLCNQPVSRKPPEKI